MKYTLPFSGGALFITDFQWKSTVTLMFVLACSVLAHLHKALHCWFCWQITSVFASLAVVTTVLHLCDWWHWQTCPPDGAQPYSETQKLGMAFGCCHIELKIEFVHWGKTVFFSFILLAKYFNYCDSQSDVDWKQNKIVNSGPLQQETKQLLD